MWERSQRGQEQTHLFLDTRDVDDYVQGVFVPPPHHPDAYADTLLHDNPDEIATLPS